MSGKTVTKRELSESIAANVGCTQVAAKAIVQQFLAEMVSQLAKGNRIELRDFGVFSTRVLPRRRVMNPQTHKTVDAPAKAVVHFKMGKKMAAEAQQVLRHLRPR